MTTHKLKVRIIDLKEIEIKAESEKDAIKKFMLMHSRDIAKLVGKKEGTFTGWSVIEQ